MRDQLTKDTANGVNKDKHDDAFHWTTKVTQVQSASMVLFPGR
jgi:hypothetical protein